MARLFIPGQEGLIEGESRAGSVVDRIVELGDEEAAATLADVMAAFGDRHRDLTAILNEHFDLVAHRIDDPGALSPARRLLVGAYFTQEYAVEAAAVCNPSIVAHPDQSDLSPGETRVVISLRAVGEGHRSCIEFRTGILDVAANLALDDPGRHLATGQPGEPIYQRDLFHRVLRALGAGDERNVSFVLDSLPPLFTNDDLERALGELLDQLVTRRSAAETIERIRLVAASNYEVTFPAESRLSERILSPRAPAESHGMEDARFVRFTDDGTTTYYATYTVYDGVHVGSQLLATDDFRTFSSTQLTGRGARNKGMALFPRRINGRFVALSRWDRESNAIMTTEDPTIWDHPVCLQRPSEPWDLVQLGNCGSPIETPAGWIMLTHGVGPMRRYVMGAELLDIDDPRHVIGHLRQPLLVPIESERDGYVPNVVYSCGAMAHHDRIVIPYGMADANISVASISIAELLDHLT
jgi:predicted GH43/DUF377 family glycosyl hydrolase